MENRALEELIFRQRDQIYSTSRDGGDATEEGETLLCQSRLKNDTDSGVPALTGLAALLRFEIFTSYSLQDGSALRPVSSLIGWELTVLDSYWLWGNFAIFGCWQFVAVIVALGDTDAIISRLENKTIY